MWTLAKKFTNAYDLRDLAFEGLDICGDVIDRASYKSDRDISLAAYSALKTWFQRQNNRQEAYSNLLEALRRCKFNQMANELRENVEGLGKTSAKA